jgi:ankyrin repeat protein
MHFLEILLTADPKQLFDRQGDIIPRLWQYIGRKDTTPNTSLTPDIEQATPSTQSAGDATASESTTDLKPAESEFDEAPNISLNLHSETNDAELTLFAICGILLQSGVLVFSAFTAYQPSWKAKLGGLNSSAGFPLLATGTACLVTGMAFCSFIIDKSTREDNWHPKDEKEMRIMWLQTGAVVGDQSFDSFLLTAESPPKRVRTSRRMSPSQEAQAIKPTENSVTLFAVCLGLFGFIVQFEGFRLSNWSNTVAQLVAVFIMTCLRAWARRGLIKTPIAWKLPKGYEMDWLAFVMVRHPDFLWNKREPDWTLGPFNLELDIDTTPDQNYSDSEQARTTELRRRLAQLTKWEGPLSNDAISLANSIEIVLRKLKIDTPGHVKWNVIVRDDQSKDPQQLGFEFKPEQSGESTQLKRRLTADSTKLEAVLSLWNYQLSIPETVPNKTPSLPRNYDWLRTDIKKLARPTQRRVGPDTDALYQDLAWYIGEEVARESRDTSEHEGGVDAFRWGYSGFDGRRNSDAEFLLGGQSGHRRSDNGEQGQHEDGDKARKSLIVSAPWEHSMAQHIFSAFLWAIRNEKWSELLDKITLVPRSFNVDDFGTWYSPRLESAELLQMAREVQSTGLGTLEQIYLSFIPPLSQAMKLHADEIFDLVLDRAHEYEKDCRWSKAADIYCNLLKTARGRAGSNPEPDRFVLRALTGAVEFFIQATAEPISLDPDLPMLRIKGEPTLEEMELHRLADMILEFPFSLREKYVKQGREEQYDSSFTKRRNRVNKRVEEPKVTTVKNNFIFKDGTDSYGWAQNQYTALHNDSGWELAPNNVRSIDIAGKTILHYAAQHGKMSLLAEILAKNAGVSIKGRDGKLPLHLAAQFGHKAVVERLISFRKDTINDLDYYRRTPLLLAASAGHDDVVEDLIGLGATLEANARDGQTPLSKAARNGHETVFKRLLDVGAVFESKDEIHRTPLCWAAINGHADVVRLLLLEAKAKVEAEDVNKRTPLSWAASEGHETVVRLLLLEGKADIEAKDDVGWTPLSWAASRGHETVVRLLLFEAKVDIEAKDKYGRTPLSCAASEGHEAVVRLLLLEAKADIEAKDEDGRTPLSCAASEGHEGVVRLLLKAKADIEAKDKVGRTSLSRAASEERKAVVRLLLEAKADIEAKDEVGRTPLLWAASEGREDVVRLLLLEAKADIEAKDDVGRTPLSCAAGRGREAVVRLLLLEGKADIEAKDDVGRTPLSWAAGRGREAVVRLLLLEAKADIEAEDINKRTPLSWAASEGHEGVVKLLLKAKADIKAKDKVGRTPLLWATEKRREAIVRLLKTFSGI